MEYTLIHKRIDPEKMEVLYGEPFTPESFARDFEVRGGEWRVEDGWLTGRNRENFAAMAISQRDFFGDVMLDFEARTLPPCTHDINVMWNGSWNETTNTRDVAYVMGLQGWWNGKVGFERSPEYAFNAGTPLFDFHPGQTYHMQCGSIGGHVFCIVDGRLLLEVTDPSPIDSAKYGRVGFEAYCSQLQFRNFQVRRAACVPLAETYRAEF